MLKANICQFQYQVCALLWSLDVENNSDLYQETSDFCPWMSAKDYEDLVDRERKKCSLGKDRIYTSGG